MKKKLHYKFIKLLFACLLIGGMQYTKAQNAVIEQSRFIGGSALDRTYGSKTVSGNTYIWGSTQSAGLPVTNGSSYGGVGDLYISKFNSAGTLLFASYFGGSNTEQNATDLFEIVGDDIYFAGATYSANLPATNGSTFTGDGGNSDLFLAKMNTVTGAIVFCTYYSSVGLTGDDFPYVLRVSAGAAYLISGVLPTYPVTTGATFMGGLNDYGITKFDGNTGNAVWSTIFGSNGPAEFAPANMNVVSNTIYVGGRNNFNATAFTPSTDGTALMGAGDVFYAQFDASTGNKTLLTFYGGPSTEVVYNMQIDNGDAYFTGHTVAGSGPSFPTTDGSIKKAAAGTPDFFALKYTAAGTVAYATIIGGTSEEGAPFGLGTTTLSTGSSVVVNGSLYFVGTTASSNYPTTNGATHGGNTTAPIGNDIAITKLSPSGTIVFSTQIGSSGQDNGVSISVGCNDELYVLGNMWSTGSLPVTSGSTNYSGSALFKWNTATGQLLFSSYLTIGLTGGTSLTGTATPVSLEYLSNGVVQVSGYSLNSNYAVTIPGNIYGGSTDMVLTRINTCPTGYTGNIAVTPASQTVCVNGVVNQIVMAKAVLSAASSPTIYMNGAPSSATNK
jgi:hypothetical protein